jgi:hypothetical protein
MGAEALDGAALSILVEVPVAVVAVLAVVAVFIKTALQIPVAAAGAHIYRFRALLVAPALSSFVTRAHNAEQAARLLPLVGTRTTHLHHPGHTHHESFCTN